ncbi:hypothetical protein A3A14_04315 [Candidatus Daviesbacteria bacterium RIFCSPLOWO2_01_FULL_43_38]|nr:MAG: hypothetical protein A3A14_04315 [Candidatus Daviesbacteria bacterium RIFCSPLOWO2_01_FULL_43_38]
MNCIYILQSSVNGRFYIGSTNDLDRRITEHCVGKTKSLQNLRPLQLVFHQEYQTIEQARIIERKLKKLKSRVIIERIIKEGFVSLGS